MTLTDEEKIEEALRVIEDLMDILQRSRAGYQNAPYPDTWVQSQILTMNEQWINSIEKIKASLSGTVDPNTGLRSE